MGISEIKYIKMLYLESKYNFLREAVKVKRELRKYSVLNVEDENDSSFCKDDSLTKITKIVCRDLAAWSFYFDIKNVKTAYVGGLDRAKKTLSSLIKENERYDFL